MLGQMTQEVLWWGVLGVFFFPSEKCIINETFDNNACPLYFHTSFFFSQHSWGSQALGGEFHIGEGAVRVEQGWWPTGSGVSLSCRHRAQGFLVSASHPAWASCHTGTCHSGIRICGFPLLLAFDSPLHFWVSAKTWTRRHFLVPWILGPFCFLPSFTPLSHWLLCRPEEVSLLHSLREDSWL